MAFRRRIAVIPARAGSKRIKHKNIVDFMGKPLIAWTIEAAIESQLFDKILVSTDSEEIADVAMTHGAEVPFLRVLGHDDHSPISVATTHSLRQAIHHWGDCFDDVVQLMANCPLRTAQDILNVVEQLQQTSTNSVLSGFEYGWSNPWWAHRLDKSGEAKPLFGDEALKKRSQDLENLYCISGAVWAADVKSFLEHETFYMPSYTVQPIPFNNAVDIDDQHDLLFAKALFMLSKEVESISE